jgi:GNAT superfamily N-acetyltransferase
MTTLDLDTELICLPEAPELPGLTFRRFRGASDYAHMAAVIEASKVADGIERTDTVDDIARVYARLNNCDPYQDMLFAEVEGELIAYNRVWWQTEASGNRLYTHIGFMKPAWRRKGIGRAMLRYNERRLREIAAEHPDDGPRFFQVFGSDTEPGKEALFQSEGYAAVRHGFNMTRPLAEPLAEPITVTPLPEGVEIRPVPPEHYRSVWEADQEAFRDHWGYVPGTEVDYQAWLNDPNFSPGLWKVAWDVATHQVAGTVQNFVNVKENEEYHRQRGYTEGIFTSRPWRKRGLARALLTRSLQMFKDMGFTEAALGVDAENLSGALRLYQSVGFRAASRQTVYRKPLT